MSEPEENAASESASAGLTPLARLAQWRRTHLRAMSVPGAFFATLFYVGSMTPSLLPRPWYLQGVIAAICALFGYVLGVLVGAAFDAFKRWSSLTIAMNTRARKVLGWTAIAAMVAIVVGFPASTMTWQRRTAQLVGVEPPKAWFVFGSALVAVALFAAFVGLWRLVVQLNEWLSRIGRRMVPPWVAKLIATALVAVTVGYVLTEVIFKGFMDFASRSAKETNNAAPSGYRPPTSPLRSGGPGSAESWESLGSEGAMFVSGGPSADQIQAATGSPAMEPIRAYAGLTDGRTIEDVAQAVVAELDRTGAFDRSAIAVFTTTGRGWVNEWNASAFEYLGGGDTAIAAMQYSTLPSPLALLTETDAPPAAAKALFNAVADRIADMPTDERPRLYVGGESLGAFGGNAAFDSADDMLSRVDGAVWCGTPGFTPIHKSLTAQRQGGSTEVNPVIDNGQHFRFASGPAELTADQFGRALGAWEYPRVVYLQHPSDPVVWWSAGLLGNTPDWLDETREGQAGQLMSWIPFVTFWQVTADMAVATDVPSGYGHQYHEELVPTWAAVLGKNPQADYAAITTAIRNQ